MAPPFDKFILSKKNPLGIDGDVLTGKDAYVSKVKVLEYKYSLDGLIEELQSDVKDANDIGLIVAWEMGTKWPNLRCNFPH
jgi:hypothetical protein